LSGTKKSGTREIPGRTSVSSCSILPPVSRFWLERPVILWPGRARFDTKPDPIGSATPIMTIGIESVLSATARVDCEPPAMITSGRSATSSVASSRKRSGRPSVERSSRTRLRPSTQPRSRSASTQACQPGTAAGSSTATRATGDCARAAIGQPRAAPQSELMRSRRFRSCRRPPASRR
jgi:hypothetical protein